MAKISIQGNGASPTPREAHWRAVSQAWEKSGLSQAIFCRRRGHSLSAFHHWRGELRRRDQLRRSAAQRKRHAHASGPGVSGFAEVRVIPAVGSPSWPVEVALPDGKVMRVARDVDSETLRKVIGVLDEAHRTPATSLEGRRPC